MKPQWISEYVGSPVFVIELCKIATVDRMSIERAANFCRIVVCEKVVLDCSLI